MYKKIDQKDIDFLLTILDKEDVVIGDDIFISIFHYF